MPPRNRLSVDEQVFRDNEREPSRLTEGRQRRHEHINKPRLNESRFNNTTMLCCGESRCVCTCPDCGERNVAGRGAKCDTCSETRSLQIAREHRESIKAALWLEMQLGEVLA